MFHFSHFWLILLKGEYCLDLAATTAIFLSLVFSVHWNVIDKNDLNEVQIVFALHWGHFWGQCTLNTRLKKIAVVAAKSKQYSPLIYTICNGVLVIIWAHKKVIIKCLFAQLIVE